LLAALIVGLWGLAIASSSGALAELPPPTGDAANPQGVRETADEITSRPEYQVPPKNIVERVQEAVGEWIGKVFTSLGQGGVSSAFGWIIVVLLIGVVAFFAFRVARTVQRDAAPPVEIDIEVQRSAPEWRSEAERFEAAGDWKEALRCRYRALVADLVDRSVVPDIPGRTVGEHRRDVRDAVPDATDDFSGAAELFERAWYGDLPTGASENQQFRSLSGRVLERASR
jgi:hypothetical protein